MKNYIFNDRKITGQIKYKKICITFSWRIQKVPSRSRDLKNMGIKYEKIEQILSNANNSTQQQGYFTQNCRINDWLCTNVYCPQTVQCSLVGQ